MTQLAADGFNTSIYLNGEQREILDALAASTGRSRSQVIRELIQSADGSTLTRVSELVGELADLLELR